ncbi:MAG: response regulator [Selenomonadaceae bacterium]|nr:response regulator [Selenomonadaceae bacterium]
MEERTYEIPCDKENSDYITELLEKIRLSSAYKEAKSVYVKLLFADVPKVIAEKMLDFLTRHLPKARILGMSLTLFAQNYNGIPFVRMSCNFFKSSKVDIFYQSEKPECYMTAGKDMAARLKDVPDKKAVEVFTTGGVNVDVSKYIRHLTAPFEDIPFFGAVAGVFEVDAEIENIFHMTRVSDVKERFKEKGEQYVVADGKIFDDGAALAVFSGEDLNVKCDYLLGWKPLGREFKITKMLSPTCVDTIDDKPAASIFERYLGAHTDDKFLFNVCEFPFLVERNGVLLGRVPPCYDDEKRIYFNCDLQEGEIVRLSYGHPQEILRDTWEKSEEMRAFAPENLSIVACGNRAFFLQENARIEIDDYSRFFPQLVVANGQAEIYTHHGQGGVLNTALVVCGMREGENTKPLDAVETCVCPYAAGGEIIPLSTRLATFLNVTAEDLKEKAIEAEKANVAKSKFLSNMSHEIRTPINAILGMDEMILRECKDERILEYAENIRSASANLLGIVNDILDFSKIEAGKLDIIPVEYELSSLLNDLVNMVETRAKKKGLAFHIEVPEDIPSVLYGDEIRIKQVVTNILTNAVKYTEQGSVTLKITFTKEGDILKSRCSVIDTGIGIKEEDLHKLFRAFERIEESRNRTIEGTGLGMNITERLLALMGSKLEVESVYGKGSAFSFELTQKIVNDAPMGRFEDAYRQTLKKRETYKESFVAPNATILVVDDTAMNLTVVKGLLKATKINIRTAESGYEALKLVTEEKYDIIFLDHRMPGIDGIETLQRMKELPNNLNKGVPVVSLTANAVSGAKKIYMDAGFDAYLTKPIDSHQLEGLIIKYLPKDKIEIIKNEENEDKSKSQESETSESNLPKWLYEVEGLDVHQGIVHCGSEETYLGALTVFAEAIEPGVEEIRRYFETKDYKSYTVKVHALKSTARIIGAKELSERAKRLEDAGNAGYIEEIAEHTPALLSLYESYLQKLSPLLKQGDDADKPEMPADEVADAFNALKEVAETFDYDSLMMMLDELGNYKLPEGEAAKYRELKSAAKIPDWDRVKEILE